MSTNAYQVPPVPGSRNVPPYGARCSGCQLLSLCLCLPCNMSAVDMDLLDGLFIGRRKVMAGQTLYREGDRFHYLYAVRSGMFKSSLMLADGREQVCSFHMSGELMGLDGIAEGVHASAAMALENAEMCVIPYTDLNELAAQSSTLQYSVGRLMSREIVREHWLMMILGSMNSEQRLAMFLLDLAQRLKVRGYSASEFHLRMSRAEIGSYLGMQLETVSRAFSALQQRHVLEVDKRHIRILDLDALSGDSKVTVH